MTGTLYIVATPIGNLEDITFRAVRILKEADRIACEDTRQTRKLLDHFGIAKPVVSYHEHNEKDRAAELVAGIQAGQTVALVSDAGTPLIADPGYRVVRLAREQGIPVVPIPGPSAAITALSASGLPTDHFVFLGFLPAKTGQRQKALEESRSYGMTAVWYETPHRIEESLQDVAAVYGDTEIVVARELTKLHEEFVTGTAQQVLEKLGGRHRGEFTLILGRAEVSPESDVPIEQEVDDLIRSGVPRMDALKQVARRRGLSKRDVYKAVQD